MKRLRCASLHSVTLTTSVMCFISAFVPRRFNGWTAVLKNKKQRASRFITWLLFFYFWAFSPFFILFAVEWMIIFHCSASPRLTWSPPSRAAAATKVPTKEPVALLEGDRAETVKRSAVITALPRDVPVPNPARRSESTRLCALTVLSLHRLSVHFPALQGLINHSRCCLKLFFFIFGGRAAQGMKCSKAGDTRAQTLPRILSAGLLSSPCREHAYSTRMSWSNPASLSTIKNTIPENVLSGRWGERFCSAAARGDLRNGFYHDAHLLLRLTRGPGFVKQRSTSCHCSGFAVSVAWVSHFGCFQRRCSHGGMQFILRLYIWPSG